MSAARDHHAAGEYPIIITLDDPTGATEIIVRTHSRQGPPPRSALPPGAELVAYEELPPAKGSASRYRRAWVRTLAAQRRYRP